MKSRSVRFFLGMVLIHMMWIKSPAHAQGPSLSQKSDEVQIPKEPGWADPSYRGWELVSIPGLIATFYDLDLDGRLDYQVIRKIIRKLNAIGFPIKLQRRGSILRERDAADDLPRVFDRRLRVRRRLDVRSVF